MICVNKIFDYFSRRHFCEVKYFSRDGRDLPNGVGFQRGNFLKECADNANSFVLSEKVFGGNKMANDHRGGVIVFPSAANTILDNAQISQQLATFSQGFIVACAIGKAFKGMYIDGNNERYDINSTTIEVSGLPSKDLLRLAEQIAKELHQEQIFVKDLNRNKIYIAKID